MRNLLRKHLFHQKEIIARAACVGINVLNTRFKNYNLHNNQKLRIDLIDEFETKTNSLDLEFIKPFINRADIFSIIQSQTTNTFARKIVPKPKLILVDTFSELTDQRFIDKTNGSSFCAHFSDVKVVEDFKKRFELTGLLPVSDIETSYASFFQRLRNNYPMSDIAVVHYSTKYDPRDSFRERNEVIKESIRGMQARFNLMNLDISELNYAQNEHDDFPYHYSEQTYQLIAKEWDQRRRFK